MKFEDFEDKYRQYPIIKSSFFSLEENSAYLRRLVAEWTKKGWLIQLKRGHYVFNNSEYRSKESFVIANQLYEPSYVSLESALSFYGIIPEAVYTVTSISTRKTASFTSSVGTFRYSQVKKDLFWGFVKNKTLASMIALPEKAIIDLLYIRKNEFKEARGVIESLRLDNLNIINPKALVSTAEKFANKSIFKIVNELLKYL